MSHSINRTSPFGQEFIGTCFKCGKKGLTIEQAIAEPCPNTRDLSDDDALVEAIEGEQETKP